MTVVAVLLACGPSGSAERVDEVLVPADVTSARTVEGAALVWREAGAWWTAAPGSQALLVDEAAPELVGACLRPNDELLLASSAQVSVYAGFLQSSPVDEALDGEVRQLACDGADAWFLADGLSRWRDDTLSVLEVGGSPGRFAAGGRVDGQRVLWVAADGGLTAWAEDGGGYRAVASVGAEEVTELAVDGDGRLWAVADGDLWAWGRSGWSRAARRVNEVAASAALPGAWIAGDDRLARITEEEDGFEEVELGPLGGLHGLVADDAGRVVALRDGALVRVSTGPTLVVSGLDGLSVLQVPVALVAAPSPVEAVTSVALVVDGIASELPGPDAFGGWPGELDPAALTAGEHTVAVRVIFVDGAELGSEPRSFTAALAGEVTWTDHVEPLHEERCARCHENGTETVLASREDWVASFDDILVEVESGRMPLGGPPLSTGEVQLLRSWSDGGFLP